MLLYSLNFKLHLNKTAAGKPVLVQYAFKKVIRFVEMQLEVETVEKHWFISCTFFTDCIAVALGPNIMVNS